MLGPTMLRVDGQQSPSVCMGLYSYVMVNLNICGWLIVRVGVALKTVVGYD